MGSRHRVLIANVEKNQQMLPANGEAQNKAADFIEGSALTATNDVHGDWGIQRKHKKAAQEGRF